MADVGESPAQLRAVIVSHIHADHAGGLVDLPGVPVLVSRDELVFTAKMKDRDAFAVVCAHAEPLLARSAVIDFAPAPYETFDTSFDFFGDGSVVFVPLAGHTPGSMGTFVSRSPRDRLLHVGDATDSVEAIDKRVGKSFALSWTDHDSAEADKTLAKLAQLHEIDPALVLVPAHDRIAWTTVFPEGPGSCVGP